MDRLQIRKTALLAGLWLALGTMAHAQTYSRTEVIAYHDNTSKWVLSQVASVQCTVSIPASTACNGNMVSQTTYDSAFALPTQTKAFGKIQQSFAYDTTSSVASGQRGTLKTIKDGNNNATTYTSWKRGIPQLIRYPATPDQPSSEFESAEVNNDGTIASITDENGYKTSYSYDAMGRLASIDYPDETNLTWNNTSLSFVKINVPEYNIPAGHWRQTVMTGTGRKLVYFDALWRPLIVREDDTSQITATRRVTRHAYDAAGRLSFTSYPVADGIPPDVGIHTTYDALDRVTSVTQDSELGPLTTTTEYLPGFQTRITNPRGKQTLTTLYLTYDQPSYEWPRGINHPEGAYTEIYRDVFGKPTAVKRRNSTGSIAATRYWMYDANQLLCKSVEPETGTTIYRYDGASNLTKTSFGIPLTTPSACSSTLAGIDGVPPPTGGGNPPSAAHYATRTYDARNRITSLVFSDHSGDTTYSYTPDNLLAAITADNGGANQVTTEYTYNRRRLMIRERLLWGNASINWAINYAYNANGHLSSQNWHGLTVDYAPNALDQPQQAGSYADNVSYYPNGAIKQFTYGNGIVHTMTQNARQLPERSRDVYGSTAFLDDSYDYDKNGNVAGISDALPGHRGDRTMTYDGLDRLLSTTSPMFLGGATYRYDVLDNLTRVIAPGRNHFYCYDARWRLTNVKTGSCSGTTVIGLGYDVQGNLANKNGQAFDFDHGNRLRSVSGRASYIYDGHGRRVRDASVGQGNKVSQYNRAGQLALTSNGWHRIVADYIYLGGSLVAIRERNVDTNTYTTRYQHTDALGSTAAVTNQSRQLIERSEYEPYGRLLNRANDDRPGYTGHVMDAATGLVYMQQRYYDPGIGRFLSVDPVTADANTGVNFNRYWYANNNPYKFTDPDGRQNRLANWENKNIHKIEPPPRAEGDWLGPAIGVALTGMLAAPVAAEVGMAALANPGAIATATEVAAGAAGVTGTAAGTAGALRSTGGVVREFEQSASKLYFRVFSGDATVGRWLTSVMPRSSAWAQEALSLPPANKATMVQQVLVPVGTRLERSRALPVPEWGRWRGGAEQFRLLDEIPPENFGPGTPLP